MHALDRVKRAERLSRARPATCPPLNVCVQVNISGEASKSGVAPPRRRRSRATVARLPRLRLRGLMGIAALGLAPAAQREQFARLREARERIGAEGLALDTLSMGMSERLRGRDRRGRDDGAHRQRDLRRAPGARRGVRGAP